MIELLDKIRKIGILGGIIGLGGVVYTIRLWTMGFSAHRMYWPDLDVRQPYYHIGVVGTSNLILTIAVLVIAVSLFLSVPLYIKPHSKIVAVLAGIVFLVSGILALQWIIPYSDSVLTADWGIVISPAGIAQIEQLWSWSAMTAFLGFILVGIAGVVEKPENITARDSHRFAFIGGALALVVALFGGALDIVLIGGNMDWIILGTILSSLAYLALMGVFYKPLGQSELRMNVQGEE